MPQAAVPTDVADAAERRIVGRVIVRLIPFLCLLFIVNYLDRTNIAMAKLRMLGDVGISEQAYGLGAGMFFLGYFLFEVPSNLILERVGARLWITRIMVTWGLISAAMMWVRGPVSLSVVRFLLGAAEAGFFPGIVLYLTYWIPHRRRASVLAWFLTATAVSGVIGNPLAGLLMQLNGVGSMHGWQWLFLLEGILPVLLGVVTLALLPDRPAHAKWLAPADRQWLDRQLAGERHHSAHHVAELKTALADVRLWLLAGIYFMLMMGLYGFIYWVPSLIQSVTSATALATGVLSAAPYLVAAVTMVLIGRHADRHNERRWHIAGCCLLAAVAIIGVTRAHSAGSVIPALAVAAVGIWGTLGPFWALATRFLRGGAAAGGIAIVNSLGNLAGFVAPYVIGWVKQHTGGFGGMLFVSAALVCGAILVLRVPPAVDRSSA